MSNFSTQRLFKSSSSNVTNPLLNASLNREDSTPRKGQHRPIPTAVETAFENAASPRNTKVRNSNKVQLTLETLVQNFVSNHVRAHCLKSAEVYVKEQKGDLQDILEDKPTDTPPDSGKDVSTPLLSTRCPEIFPSCEEGFAAVVMADVSGYSKLSSRLAEKGNVGAELLFKAMKGYLDQVSFAR